MKRLFSLSSQQYNKKYTQLVEPDKNTTKLTAPIVPTEFSKVEVREASSSVVPSLTEKAQATSNDVTHLKSPDNSVNTYVDPKTIIVEYIRPDGHRLNIHTTTSSIAEVMKAFGEDISE